MSTRTELNTGAGAVRSGLEIDTARLESWMEANVAGYRGPAIVEQFRGGQSNPTYRLRTAGAAYVLRRKPPGRLLPGAHAIDREYRIQAALADSGVAVARMHGLCLDETVIGTPFYVMELVAGRIFWDASLPGLEPDERAACFDSMNATIAALHSIPLTSVGLADYGKANNYLGRQISRWTSQYLEDTQAGRNPYMGRLIEWLPAHIPAEEECAILHGDYRCDNLIFHHDEPRVAAILDWELSTIGHPLADFAYHAMMYRMPPDIIAGLAGVDLAVRGIPSEESYVAAYCRRTGRGGLPDFAFYLAFAMFRLAGIVHGIKGRVLRGTASSAHAHEMAAKFERIAELGWAQAMESGRRDR
jgi:aminoglycoside phosphotransferase (APT) family kinase protein